MPKNDSLDALGDAMTTTLTTILTTNLQDMPEILHKHAQDIQNLCQNQSREMTVIISFLIFQPLLWL